MLKPTTVTATLASSPINMESVPESAELTRFMTPTLINALASRVLAESVESVLFAQLALKLLLTDHPAQTVVKTRFLPVEGVFASKAMLLTQLRFAQFVTKSLMDS